MSGGTHPQRGEKTKNKWSYSYLGGNKDKRQTTAIINSDGDTTPLFWEKNKHDK